MADLFADIPEGYTRNRMDPELRKVLEHVAGRVRDDLGGGATRVTSTAPYVEVTSMAEKSNRWLLLHVVNYDVTVDGVITPARGLKVQVAVPRGKKARRVTWSGTLGEMKPVQYEITSKQGRQVILLDLDQVDVYGLAKIELD
jgi:hypothetical protein